MKAGVVYMPLEDLQLIHAKRKVADAILSERARAVGLMASRVEGLKVANGLLEAENQRARYEVAKAWEAAALCKDDLVASERKVAKCKDDLEASERKLARLRPWATVGKVTVCLSAVAVAVAGVGIVTDTINK